MLPFPRNPSLWAKQMRVMEKTPPLFYGWYIVLTGILVYSVGYGARYSFSVVFPSLLEEFRWPRDTTALILSVHLLVYGLVAPVTGRLIDQLGPRRTMTLGTLLLSCGLALSGWSSRPWHLYFTFGVLTGAGLCLIGAVSFTTVLRNWFERRRGLALSLVFLGAGSAFGWYPLIAYLIQRGGWRFAFLMQAVTIPILLLPLILFIVRYHPRQKGLTSDGSFQPSGIASRPQPENTRIVDPDWAAVDWTLTRAFRTRRFWLMCLSTFALWGVTQHILVAHHVAFAIDLGYSKLYVSSVLSLFGLTFALGSVAAFISDRIGREPTMLLGTVCGVSGILVLAFMADTSRPWMLYYYAVAFGLSMGLTTPTMAAAVTDIFQGPRVGAAIGFVWFSFAVGGCIGPWLGGWAFEVFGSYRWAFLLAAAWYAVACLAVWLAAPRKVRLVPGRFG